MENIYLRISVTDRCNYACKYCVPKENIKYIPNSEILSFEELEILVSTLKKIVDVSSLRLTGGEPLLRKGLDILIKKLKNLGIKDLSLTTNGYFLLDKAQVLKKAGLDRINVSLDTLNSKKYKSLTKYGSLDKVLKGLLEAKRYFKNIKINTVLIKNFTEEEIDDLLLFCQKHNFEIRFIELMNIGIFNTEKCFLSVTYIKNYLENKYGKLISIEKNSFGPAQRFYIPSLNVKIGFIPTSHNFCKTCNRLRISADGKLRLCLLNDLSIDLKKFLRDKNFSQNNLKEILLSILNKKAANLLSLKQDYCKENMIKIGG